MTTNFVSIAGDQPVHTDFLLKLFCTQIAADISYFTRKHVLDNTELTESVSEEKMQTMLLLSRLGKQGTARNIAISLRTEMPSVMMQFIEMRHLELIELSSDDFFTWDTHVRLTRKGKHICSKYNSRLNSLVNKIESAYEIGLKEHELACVTQAMKIIAKRTFFFSTYPGGLQET